MEQEHQQRRRSIFYAAPLSLNDIDIYYG